MDWFSWLSKTSLEPFLVYEYSLAFAHNELDEQDIAYLNHEVLQSMGITIAKHRLEILKLARKGKQSYPQVSRLIFAIKNTKRSLGKYFRTLIHRRNDDNDDDRALVLLSAPQSRRSHNNSSRWKRAGVLSRSARTSGRKLVVVRRQMSQKPERVMMLTDGSVGGNGSYEYCGAMVVSTPRLNSFSTPLVVDAQNNNKRLLDDEYGGVYGDEIYGYDDGEQHWTPVVEEIKWDAMFQDLKPT